MHNDIIEHVLCRLRTKSAPVGRGRRRRLRLRGADSEHYRQTIETLATKLAEALRLVANPNEPAASPVFPVKSSVLHGADRIHWNEASPPTNAPDDLPEMTLPRPNALMEIHSAVVGDEVLHFVTLADGSTDEGWGLEGIERLLERHLNDDRQLLHPHFAQPFFGELDPMMTGECTITVDITAASEIENIRIMRPGQATAHYHHRFDFFVSGGWSLI